MYSLICTYNVLVNIWTNGTGYPPFNPGSEGYDGFDFTLPLSPPSPTNSLEVLPPPAVDADVHYFDPNPGNISCYHT